MTLSVSSGLGCDFDDYRVITSSIAETRAIGKRFSGALSAGDAVALNGDLGAGKTCLIKGICAGFGVEETVNSPTFILINHYSGRRHDTDIPIFHFDFYRLTGPDELDSCGADEFFDGNGICLVEWADRAPGRLPDHRWVVDLEYVNASRRDLHFYREP